MGVEMSKLESRLVDKTASNRKLEEEVSRAVVGARRVSATSEALELKVADLELRLAGRQDGYSEHSGSRLACARRSVPGGPECCGRLGGESSHVGAATWRAPLCWRICDAGCQQRIEGNDRRRGY
jgi:hypothetical protein